MMRALLLLLLAGPAGAETLVATRALRPGTVLQAADVTLAAGDQPGALSDPGQAVGMETRVAIYAGRPILPGDIGPVALVDRNQIVPLAYRNGNVTIRAEGRALARGGVGDVIKVMNTASHSLVSGVVAPDGSVVVGGLP